MYNLVGHVINRLDGLDAEGMLTRHPFISEDEIHVKIGGDHGDTSFKFCYQIANVSNPNSKENTVVFSIFEAKDTRPNLKTCLSRYKAQVNITAHKHYRTKIKTSLIQKSLIMNPLTTSFNHHTYSFRHTLDQAINVFQRKFTHCFLYSVFQFIFCFTSYVVD